MKTVLHIQLIFFKFELRNIGVYYLNMLSFVCLRYIYIYIYILATPPHPKHMNYNLKRKKKRKRRSVLIIQVHLIIGQVQIRHLNFEMEGNFRILPLTKGQVSIQYFLHQFNRIWSNECQGGTIFSLHVIECHSLKLQGKEV